MTALAAERADGAPAEPRPERAGGTPGLVRRWAPFAAAALACAVLLLITGTSVLDLLRYAAYVVLAVALPGTLVYQDMDNCARRLSLVAVGLH